jgi:hypothetical protein
MQQRMLPRASHRFRKTAEVQEIGLGIVILRQLTRNNVPGSRRIFVRIQGVKTGA